MKKLSSFSWLILFISLSVRPLFAFDIEGVVKVEPPYPEPQVIEVPQEYVKDFGLQKTSSKLKISPEGFLANAVLELKGVSNPQVFSGSDRKKILNQLDGDFIPHITLLPKGGELVILNSEPVSHNVRSFDEESLMLFNLPMTMKGQIVTKKYDREGRFLVRCGIHKWMHAFVIVQDHPFYAVTDENGQFKITDIPDGRYSLTIWHETLGEMKMPVDKTDTRIMAVYPKKG